MIFFLLIQIKEIFSFSSRQRHNEGMPIISIGAQQPRLLAPGAVARLEYEAKILRNPFNKRNRQLLHENYGIQLPLIEKQQQQRTVIVLLSFSVSYLLFNLATIKTYHACKNN
jgi:hypothetical protein